MACLALLPVELLHFVIDNLDSFADLSSLAQTDHKLYSLAIPILYQRAALQGNPKPLSWAAQHGIVSTLQRALAAGLDPNCSISDNVPLATWSRANTIARTGTVSDDDAAWDTETEHEEPAERSPETEDSDHPPTITTHDPSSNSNSSHQWGLDRTLDDDSYSDPDSDPHNDSDISMDGDGDALDYRHAEAQSFINNPTSPLLLVRRSYQPIHLAALGGHRVIVEMLLDGGADIDAPASQLCDCPRLYGLLNAAECPEVLERHHTWTPLHFALCRSRPETAKLLLSRGASHVVQVPDGPGGEDPGAAQGVTALHDAARMGLGDVVRYLVDKGIQTDVNVRDAKTLTPLYHAYAGRRWDSTVPLLLELGANINVDIKLYIPYTAITPMGEACRLGHFDAVDRLLDLGADATHGFTVTTTGASLSPLHMCCMRSARPAPDAPDHSPRIYEEEDMGLRRMHTIQKLIDKGASLNATDCNGDTPLIAAAQNHNVPAVRALLRAGVSVRDRNPAGRNALMQAIMGPQNGMVAAQDNADLLPQTLRLLAHGGVPLDEADSEGNTLLHLIFNSPVAIFPSIQKSVLRILLNMPGVADLSRIRNGNGKTPLHLAFQARNLEACDVLVRRGCLRGGLGLADLLAMFDDAIATPGHQDTVDFVLDLDVHGVLTTDSSLFSRLLAKSRSRYTAMRAACIIAERGLPPVSPVDATRLLCMAIRMNELTLAYALLDNGADVNACSDDGEYALSACIKNMILRNKPDHSSAATIQLLQALLDRGANPHLPFALTGIRLLNRVISHNLEDALVMILKRNPLAADPRAFGGAYLHTALTFPAGEPRPISEKMIDLLLASGANLYELNKEGDTPLSVLLRSLCREPGYAWRYHRFIKALAAPGIDIDRRNDEGKSIVEYLQQLMYPDHGGSGRAAFLTRRIQIVDDGGGNHSLHFLPRPKKGGHDNNRHSP